MIAHADYPSAEYGWHKPVDAQRVLWDRDRLMGFMVGKGQGISGADHFWFGHTPVDKRYDFNNLHYIDTGQYSGLSDAGAASVINNPPSGGFFGSGKTQDPASVLLS